MSDARRTMQWHSTPVPARTPANTHTLADALRRLSAHRNDDIATAAVGILAQLETLGDEPTAQQFEPVHARVLAARLSAPVGLGGDWRAAHGIARAVYVRLVRRLKTETHRRASSGAVRPQTEAQLGGPCRHCGHPQATQPAHETHAMGGPSRRSEPSERVAPDVQGYSQ